MSEAGIEYLRARLVALENQTKQDKEHIEVLKGRLESKDSEIEELKLIINTERNGENDEQ